MNTNTLNQLIVTAQDHIDKSRIASDEVLHNFHIITAQRALDFARDYINASA